MEFSDIKRRFDEFLEHVDYADIYGNKIRTALSDKKFRVVFNINDIRNYKPDLAANILSNPRMHLLALQKALNDHAKNLDPSHEKILKSNELQVGFEGSFGAHAVSPRGLLSTLLNKMVVVEGIVTKCSAVRPKLMKSVHFCPETRNYETRHYRDGTAIDIGLEIEGRTNLPTSSAFPTKDENGNPLETEHGLCQYKDYQTIVLQEMPERAKVGQLPRSIELILEHDLVDKVKPGDRCQCVGIYRPLPSVRNNTTSGLFKSILICNSVSVIGKEVGAVKLSGYDVGNIRGVSEKPYVLDILGRSFCPSIFGHEFVKKALILQLLGGCERNLDNGTHLRGDINVMMVGDPSTAKSQLLRAVMDIAPLAISTTGRGSSGVGLTAAVTSDPDTNERRLEAGAMVLADRGCVCIDEFDKMSENDRVAIHEVMEQQTVTIAKAGIHASLNARCSVVAAANPIYGQYDRQKTPQMNIGLPDSLLSRFDLLFIVLDQLDPTLDRRLSEHVIRSHQYRRPGVTMEPEPLNETAASILEDDRGEDRDKDTVVWQRGGRGSEQSSGTGTSRHDVLTKEFLRKYIHYAKSRIKPVLSEDAMEAISAAYSEMRSKQSVRNLPVTARTLETIIRLSSAHAKSRLSNSVDEIDVEAVLDIVNFVMFHEIGKAHESSDSRVNSSSGKRKIIDDGSTSNDDEEEEDENGIASSTLLKRSRGNENVDDEEGDGMDSSYDVDRESSRYQKVLEVVRKVGDNAGGQPVEMEVILNRLNTSEVKTSQYTSKELVLILSEIERENKIMFDDGEVYIL